MRWACNVTSDGQSPIKHLTVLRRLIVSSWSWIKYSLWPWKDTAVVSGPSPASNWDRFFNNRSLKKKLGKFANVSCDFLLESAAVNVSHYWQKSPSKYSDRPCEIGTYTWYCGKALQKLWMQFKWHAVICSHYSDWEYPASAIVKSHCSRPVYRLDDVLWSYTSFTWCIRF